MLQLNIENLTYMSYKVDWIPYLWKKRKAKSIGELRSMKTNNVGTVPRSLMVISIKNLLYTIKYIRNIPLRDSFDASY